jgi:hypothetical protein
MLVLTLLNRAVNVVLLVSRVLGSEALDSRWVFNLDNDLTLSLNER